MGSHIALTRDQVLMKMDEALCEEIKKKSNERQVKHIAVDGKLISEGNGQYIYQFTLLEPWTPEDDAPLRIDNEDAQNNRCSVVTATGTLLTIATEQMLPVSLLRKINLWDDSTALLERQREALRNADEGKNQLASKSFGLLPYQQHLAYSDQYIGKELREAQYLAAQKALGGEVTFIVGPPGTGKTLTLAAIVFQHLRAKRTVLLAAHTNIAVDNAIMKLCELCKQADRANLLGAGQVVRYGAVQKAELKNNPYYVEVYLPSIVQKLRVLTSERQQAVKTELDQVKRQVMMIQQQQTERIPALKHEQEEIESQLAVWKSELSSLEHTEQLRVASLQRQLEQQREPCACLEREIIRLSQHLARLEAQVMEKKSLQLAELARKEVLLKRLVEVRAMNSWQRFFKRINVEKMEVSVAQSSQVLYEVEQMLHALEPDVLRTHQELATYRRNLQTRKQHMADITALLQTPPEITQKLDRLKESIAHTQSRSIEITTELRQIQDPKEVQALEVQQERLRMELAQLDQELRDVEKSIAEKALVVGTTLTKTYMNQTIASRRFDAVILDEVSMASMPLVYLATSHADLSVTLIGDPQQLAPIVSAENQPTAKEWLGKNLFNLRNITLRTAKDGYQHSVMLNVQSRMHPAISHLANELVYARQLCDAFDETSWRKVTPLPESPLVLCNTQDANPVATRPANNRSWQNYYHALCCIALARKMLDADPNLKKKEPTIGIVAPYTGQAKLLQSLIKDEGLQFWVQAGTVHRFQGLEFEIILFDTVASTNCFVSDFISGGIGSSTMRLLNVAVTRAKSKLVIVANQNFIIEKFWKDSMMRRVVEMAAQAASVHSLEVVGTPFASLVAQAQQNHSHANTPQALLEYIDLKRQDVLTLSSSGEVQVLTEETFYELFKRDLQQASKSIMIVSPYLTENRLRSFLSVLQEQQNKGIALTIEAIIPSELNGEDKERQERAVKLLHDGGFEVKFLSNIHQKPTIIDDVILYDGSMNMLSHRNTTENIYRMTLPHIIRQVRETESQRQVARRSIDLSEAEIAALNTVEVPIGSLPASIKKCDDCGSALVAKFRRADMKVFYGCPNYKKGSHEKSENLSLDHLEQIKIFQQQSCSTCGTSLEPWLTGRDRPIILLCSGDCGAQRKVVFVRGKPG